MDQHVIFYLDDIIVYSMTLAEQKDYLGQVLQKLREHKLYAELNKCDFCKSEGQSWDIHQAMRGSNRTLPRLRLSSTGTTPKNVHELKAFLGFPDYFWSFIFKAIPHLIMPLLALLKKDAL